MIVESNILDTNNAVAQYDILRIYYFLTFYSPISPEVPNGGLVRTYRTYVNYGAPGR